MSDCGKLYKRGLFRSVCVWCARWVEREAWEMGVDCEENVGSYSRAGVQRTAVVRKKGGGEGVKCLTERVAAWCGGIRRKKR